MARDHMDGINALPKWDPNNPTTYAYDWKNYDRADYAQFKEARKAAGAQRLAESRAALAEAQKNANKVINQKTRDQVLSAAKAAPKHAVLRWNGESTCFESISYHKKTGILHCVFLKRDDGTGWDYDVTLDEAIDLMMSDSPGGTFNATLR